MEFKKFETKGLEGSALEFANSANALIDGLSAMEAKGVTAEELEKKMTEIKELIPTDAKAEIKLEIKSLETDLLKRINEIKSKPMEQKMVSLEQGILEALQTLDIKGAVEAKSKLKGKMVDLEVKDAIVTTNYTGDVSRTQIIGAPKFAPINANAFFGVPGITNGTVDNGKSILMWIPSSYTSNVGYVDEITAQATADAASATEKSRKMAKVAAKMQMSAEMFEDLPQFASRLAEQMRRKAELFIDNKILDGAGNDANKPNEIYGLIGEGSTAFDATPFASSYDKANVLDLLDACSTQAQLANHKVNTVRMNPVDASLLRRVKDSSGQPIVQTLVDGTPTIGGLRLITTNKLTKGTMLVSDDSLIQIWTKRGLEMKVGQYATDAEKDQYTALMFARVQCLVEDADKAGVIYVSSISDSLALIDSAV